MTLLVTAISQSRLRLGFGSFVAVEATAPSDAVATRALAAAFDALALVERLMHPTRTGSDLAALNACRPGERISVHPWTWCVLKLSQRLHQLSNGMFEPCLPTAIGRTSDLLLIPPLNVMLKSTVRVDLGGIAKGYAVDRAINALRRSGCDGGLVNAGGDLRLFGSEARRIIYRGASGTGGILSLRNHALATSDVLCPRRPPEHQGYYDGSAGRPVTAGAVTIVARRAVIADALTKCLLPADERLKRRLLAQFGAAVVTACPIDLERQS